MKSKFTIAALIVAGSMISPVLMAANPDTDSDRSHPKAFVKDSVITTKIKSKLAAEHLTSVGRIKVDTDANGVVWLTGTARSQAAIDKAGEIARSTEHVTAVQNEIKIRADD